MNDGACENMCEGCSQEKPPLHNAQIEQFGGAVYKIQPYMIPRNILLLRINRVWDSGAYLEPNSMDTEQYL